jgi:shikimate O-hydroxycinnamoyltransferase
MKRQIIRPQHVTQGVTHCSALEHQFRAIYPAMAFFYREQLDPERLQTTLARVLDDFPIYAGKLRTVGADLRVEHAAIGAAFELVKCDTPLHVLEAAGNAGQSEVLGPKISFARALFGLESLLAIKLTSTPDGCCLCVTWNHTVGDLHSTMLLMRAWASAYVGESYASPVIPDDRVQYLKQMLPDHFDVASTVHLVSWRQIFRTISGIYAASRRTVLDFSWEELAGIQSAVSRDRQVTANDALCTRIYSVVRELSGTNVPANLCMTVNYRKRVGIAPNVVGNIVNVVAQPMPGTDAPLAATGLRDQLDNFAARCTDFHACMREFDAHPKPLERMRVVSNQFRPGQGDLLVTNWTGFGAYDLAFGDARPIRFCSLSKLPAYFMVVYERPERAGIGVQISLPPRLAALLDSDAGRKLVLERDVPEPRQHPAPIWASP